MRVLCVATVLLLLGSPLLASGSCGYRSNASQTSGLSGVVRDAATGQPVSGVVALAQLLSSDGKPVCYWRMATTDEAGRYEIKDLYPGSYRIGINTFQTASAKHPYPRTFFPGVLVAEQSWPVTVAEGQHKDSVDFQTPPWHLRRIDVYVRWPNREPAPDIRVWVREGDGGMPGDVNDLPTTDAYGHAVVIGFVESGYEIFADYDGVLPNQQRGRVHAEPVWVPASEKTPSVDLVLETPGRYGEHAHPARVRRE